MTEWDYTFERQIELEKKASFEEGEERGAENKVVSQIKKKLNNSKSVDTIAEELEESLDTINGLITKYNLL